MSTTTRMVLGLSACALLFTASIAAAQAPLRVRGTVENADGNMLAVKARDGAMMKVKLTDDAKVLTLDKKSMSDVKAGTYVGITAMPQPDGSQKAVEIHIFPESMRGMGDGHYGWDLMPNSTMTNGNIETQVASTDGQTMTLKYKDGEKPITVPPDIAVVMFAPATAAEIKTGQKFFVPRGKKLDDGSIEAGVIVVGTHGVDPPM